MGQEEEDNKKRLRHRKANKDIGGINSLCLQSKNKNERCIE